MTKLFLTFFLWLLLLAPLHQADAQTVDIPDANLRTAIETALNLSAGDPITETQMATLTTLTVEAKRDFTAPPYPVVNEVTDLTGLEHATSLTTLTITNNRVPAEDQLNADKLSPILNLPLETLKLSYNNISDISGLSGLTTLTRLILEQNKIEDISPLTRLSALAHLNLWTNPITDISILTKENFPNLKYLNLRDTWVRDFSPLDLEYWVAKYNDAPGDIDAETGSALLICNSILENWYYYNDNVGPPVKDKARLEEQLNKPTCAPVFRIESTGDNTSVRLVVDADADLSPNYVTLTYVYRYRKSGDSWPATSTDDTHTPQWTGGFSHATPPGEDGAPNYQGVIAGEAVGEDETVYAADITGLDPSAVYHFQVFGSVAQGGNFRNIYPPGSEEKCWSTSEQSVVDCPPDPTRRTGSPHGLRVTFADYPEEKPIDEFTLTLRFSEPVIGFEKADITVETELDSGTGTPTLVDLTPETPILADGIPPDPRQTYIATVELPSRARGTVKLIVRADAATTPATALEEKIGPPSNTASDPIEFGRRVVLYPSHVAMDKIIFNEFRNASDDTNDWIELKNISDEPVSLKDWEVSLVLPHAIGPATPQWEILAMDRDVVAFGDYTLPAGGILLIVNTDPRETDLIYGRDIENPKHHPDLHPQYLIRPEMKLPQTPFLLILRSARDQNGKWEGFEDLVGDYHKDDVGYRTQIWPLRDTWVHTGTAAAFTEGEVWQRVMAPRVSSLTLTPTLQPSKRGYLRGAWVLSDPESPGYPTGASVPDPSSGQLIISEVMFATDARRTLPQWIELYNPSETERVSLEGWKLLIKAKRGDSVRSTPLVFNALTVLPNQTVLLVSRMARHSENLPSRRLYDLHAQHAHLRLLGARRNMVLTAEGFGLYLYSPDEALVDSAGNLMGQRGEESVGWQLPAGWTEAGARTSLIRRFENRLPAPGTEASSWIRAADTGLVGPYTYYGHPMDSGTPMYRLGSPLPVTLSQLRADRTETGVVVNWTTQSEMENAGFYVLRRREDASDFERITPSLIAGAGTTAEQSMYTYRDTTATVNVPYYYRLEEVSLSGERSAVATVRLRGHVSAANKLLWKWADVKSQD